MAINDLKYTTLDEATAEAGKVLADAGVCTKNQARAAIESYFQNLDSKASPQDVVNVLDQTHSLLSRVDETEAEAEVRTGFERVAEKVIAPQGTAALQSWMMKTIFAMPAKLRKSVFRSIVDEFDTFDVVRLLRGLDPKVRSSALVSDLVSGRVSARKLQELIAAMGPTPHEVVKLYEMLTGAVPYAGRTPSELIASAVRGNILPPRRIRSQVPAELETVVMTCSSHLSLERRDRDAGLGGESPLLARRAVRRRGKRPRQPAA